MFNFFRYIFKINYYLLIHELVFMMRNQFLIVLLFILSSISFCGCIDNEKEIFLDDIVILNHEFNHRDDWLKIKEVTGNIKNIGNVSFRTVELKVSFFNDNPVITWLSDKGDVLRRNLIDIMPQFKGMWEVEKTTLDALGVELLCPIKSHGKLVGVLALGEKQSGTSYSDEEADLLKTMSNEAAAAIENARMLDNLKIQQLQERADGSLEATALEGPEEAEP